MVIHMKKISIIVPVYNVEKYIKKCLDSLVNQTLNDIEIIVVNDGSPDDSQTIIDDFVVRYPDKVKSYIKKNGGQGSARNFGIEHSESQYVAFVDSDDYVELDMFEQMYNCAIKNNSDIVICGNNVINMESKIIKQEKPQYGSDYNILSEKMAVWNKLYKRDIIKNITFRCNVWYEDIDYTIKLLLNTNKISYVDNCLYNYLLRPGSTMNNSNIKRNLELIAAFNEIDRYFKKINNYNKNTEKIEFLCIDHMYISAIVRVINADANNKDKNIIINEFRSYVYKKFPQYKKNNYIKNLSTNRKIIYFLIKNKLYFLVKIIFKIKKM